MKSFSCIGSLCEDTCCAGWKITVDQSAYERYEQLPSGQINPLKYIKKIDNNKNPEVFGEFVMDEGLSCPMLDGQQLCSIQLKLGQQYLSNVCAMYPRHTAVIEGTYEIAASVSCPEIARLALLNPSGITFTKYEDRNGNLNDIRKYAVADNSDPLGMEYFQELRAAFIQLLQDRRCSLDERLMKLGLFCDKIQNLMGNGQTDEIKRWLASSPDIWLERIGNNQDDASSLSLPEQLKRLKRLIDIRIIYGVKNKRYLQCLMDALQGIRYTNGELTEDSLNLYIDAYMSFYSCFIREYEYILENYLVNLAFTKLHSILKGKKLFQIYALLAVKYSLVKFHLIGMSGYYKQAMNADHSIRLIQSYTRIIEHCAPYQKSIMKYLKENNLLTVQGMASFVQSPLIDPISEFRMKNNSDD
ncbi:flagellin lysine-N-methylase [Paenibacillus tarimensis]